MYGNEEFPDEILEFLNVKLVDLIKLIEFFCHPLSSHQVPFYSEFLVAQFYVVFYFCSPLKPRGRHDILLLEVTGVNRMVTG